MNRPGPSYPPSFARQGALILLPVVLLAAIGLFSLRQDKLLVRAEAAERAQVVADEFAEALWDELASGNDDGAWPSFTVDNDGRLLDPPPTPLGRELFAAARPRPAPPWPRLFWITNALPAGATNLLPLWVTSEPRFGNTTRTRGILTNQPDPGMASRRVWPSLEEYWLAVRIHAGTNTARYLCKNQLNQRLAAVFAPAAGDHSATIVANWSAIVTALTNPWPQFSNDPAAAPSPRLRALGKLVSRLPGYLGLSVDVAGHPLISSNHLPVIGLVGGGKGSGQYYLLQRTERAPALLASARKFAEGVESLRVGVHLVSPDMLYSRQKSRITLFGLLIVASAIAAVVGFVSARRAFLRQRALSDLKSNFVSSVSHELRAPIASVRLLAESLERGAIREPAKQNEYFRFIVQECRRLSSLIENVLDFARIEQGRKQYEFEPIDLPALMRQTVKLMEPAAAEKQVTLQFVFLPPTTADEPSLIADRQSPMLDGQAIQQALVNLLDNAIKHSPVGETVTVSLDCAPLPPLAPADDQFPIHDSQFSITLSVQDDGPGIPASEREKIFERFYRSGAELRRETQGVGIGLSIVKHIVEAHGGRVRVESEIGRGSRFVIELPLRPNGSKA